MNNSGTVSDHNVRSNSCRHFKTFQRVVAFEALSFPPAENHGIEIKLLKCKVCWSYSRKLRHGSLVTYLKNQGGGQSSEDLAVTS